jgi:hypothetical protein
VKKLTNLLTNFHLRLEANLVHTHHAKVLAHQIATKVFGAIIKINFEGGCRVVFKSSLLDVNFAKWDIV